MRYRTSPPAETLPSRSQHIASGNGQAQGSLDRGLQVLARLANAGSGGLPLGSISKDLGLTKSSVYRTLAALKRQHFVTQDAETGYYRLGWEFLRLSSLYIDSIDLRELLHPALEQLCEEVKEICHLGVLDGTDIVYVDKVEPRTRIRVSSMIGGRLSALTTSLGRAMLANQYDTYQKFAEDYEAKLVQRTPATPRTLKAVWDELSATRQRGYALDLEENDVGVCCVGVAIIRDGRPLGAVSVTALATRVPRESLVGVARTVRRVIGEHLRPPLELPAPMISVARGLTRSRGAAR